ncbi:MAG: hypothetical protein ACE5OZ_21550 [Candidatus Heimdallarchaeota archaeon]
MRNFSQIMNLIMAFLLLGLMGVSLVATAGLTSEQTEQMYEEPSGPRSYALEGRIVILFDPNEPGLVSTASSLYQGLAEVYENTIFWAVQDESDLRQALQHPKTWIAVHHFQTSIDTIQIGMTTFTWNDYYRVLSQYNEVDHILTIGNSRQFADQVNDLDHTPNIHYDASELNDAKVSFVWTTWTIAELLIAKGGDYRKAGRNVQNLSIKFFAENFSDLMERNIQPKDTLGEEDLVAKQARYEEMENSYPREIHPVIHADDPEVAESLKINGMKMRQPAIFLGDAEADDGNVSLMEMPIKSGLDGPIGGIVDTLLGVLIDFLGSDLLLGEDFANAIKAVISGVQMIIGLVKDPDPSSAIKVLLDFLSTQFPFIAEYQKYFELVIDFLFSLRKGLDTQDLVNLIIGAVELIIGDESWASSFFDIVSKVLSVIDNVGDFIDRIKSGESFTNILMGILQEGIVQQIIAKFLNHTLGLDPSDITFYMDKMFAAVKITVNFLSDFNVTRLVHDYLPDLLKNVFGLLTELTNENWDQLAGLMSFALKILTDYESVNLKDLLKMLLDLFFDESDFELTAGRAKSIYAPASAANSKARFIENVVGNITEAVENDWSDINTIVTMVDNLYDLFLKGTVDATLKDLIKKAILLVAGVLNDGFKTNLPNLIGLVNDTLNYFGVDLSTEYRLVNQTISTVLGVVAFIRKDFSMKKLLAGDTAKFQTQFSSIVQLVKDWISYINDDFSSSAARANKAPLALSEGDLNTIGQVIESVVTVISEIRENPIQGVIVGVVEGVGFALISEYPEVSLGNFTTILKGLLPSFFGQETDPPSPMEVFNSIWGIIGPILGSNYGATVQTMIQSVLKIIMNAREIFSNGIRWVLGQIMDWLGGQIAGWINDLLSSLTSALGAIGDWLSYEGTFPIGLSDFSLFDLKISLSLKPGFGFDTDAFTDFVYNLIFEGLSSVDISFSTIFSWFSLIPIFSASIEMVNFGTEKNPLMKFLLSSLGLELTFSGGAHFVLQLLEISGGKFKSDGFLKVIEWGFYFSITLSRDFTLLDFVTGGMGGGLNAVAEYIGLDAIVLTVFFGLSVEVIKKAASATGPEQGSLTLEITVGVALSLGIDIIIASLEFYGELKVTLTFIQDLVNPAPLEAYLGLEFTVIVTIGFLFWDWDFEFHWSPGGSPWRLTPAPKSSEMKSESLGYDGDDDGLTDEYEGTVAGLNPESSDTDGDGLSDKFEVQTSKTDPVKADTDGDGLTDYEEWETHQTNPKNPDSDWDNLNDSFEIQVLGTNALVQDTDSDGLDDFYEYSHALNMTGITPSVAYVMLGDVKYTDRTDPTNPDTDGDGLLDGQEGPASGMYYGIDNLYNTSINDTDGWEPDNPNAGDNPDANPLIFGQGYTHPLDNDTDDDAWEQLWNGTISPRWRATIGKWGVTNDYNEINGLWVVFRIEGEPVRKLIRTNPVNPDTDGDTGRDPGTDYTDPSNVPFNFYLNSDGYELALDPPSDPTDGDTDDDGLIDGLEGTLNPLSNHSHYNEPDTDGDGLGDLQEILLNADPRHPDSDRDGVADGDEFFLFGTDPFNPDTDFDMLNDGQELFEFHSNPHIQDSDGDRIKDGAEVLIYFTDPVDDDTDNDGLTDYEELFIHRTDPFEPDTDFDGLLDGEELQGINITIQLRNGTWASFLVRTDPLEWDTDHDSILYPNKHGEMTFPFGDGDEIRWGKEHPGMATDPTKGDSDADGILDGFELYLGSGLIPTWVFNDTIGLEFTVDGKIPMNPASNDTDGDGLLDGEELRIVNMTQIIFPYVAFIPQTPFNTSPVVADTDGDGLNDSEEVEIHFTRPDYWDSDNDTLSDYEEIEFHKTSPVKNDTDGDGLNDSAELTYAIIGGFSGNYSPIYDTNATLSDTDNDSLPDGAEIEYYGTNATHPDSDSTLIPGAVAGNDIRDGDEFDSDHDGLSDGLEYDYNTTGAFNGGPFNPDSDHDGLPDGFEVYEYGTHPALWDTDNDTWSDGMEILLGEDPLDPSTTNESIWSGLDDLNEDHGIFVIAPSGGGGSASFAASAFRPTVLNSTRIDSMWAEVDNSQVKTYLQYNPQFKVWEGPILTLEDGKHTMAVQAIGADGEIYRSTVTFWFGKQPQDQTSIGALQGIALVGFISLLGAVSAFGGGQLLSRLIAKRKLRGGNLP